MLDKHNACQKQTIRSTETGQAFYLRCDLAEISAEPSGTLRLTAPFDYGVAVVVPAIAAFTRLSDRNQFPGMKDQLLQAIACGAEFNGAKNFEIHPS